MAMVELEVIPCPLCESSHFKPDLETEDVLHRVPGRFRVVRCLDCRHLYMNPRPTADTILNCYPADYGPHQSGRDQDRSDVNPASAGASSERSSSGATTQPACSGPPPSPAGTRWYLHPVIRRVPGLRRLYYWLTDSRSDFIPPAGTGLQRAVELGCATGSFLEKLRTSGWSAQGVEPVESAADVARGRGFSVHAGTLNSAGFSPAEFDAAFAWMVLEHLPDPRETLNELARILRPRGWLALSVPNVGCWEPIVFRRCWYVWELPRHLQFFTPRRLERLLRECGFEEIQFIHQRNLLNVVGSLGLVLRKCFPRSHFAARLVEWPDHPTLWPQLALAPAAILLAALRQGGRLTVIARRRESSPASSLKE